MASRDVLSNEEVDALMDTVADKTANDSASEVIDDGMKIHRAFDFASREHFALAQMKGLSTANDRFCMDFQALLVQAFGLSIKVTMQNPEILKMDECMTGLKDNAVLNVMKVNLASGKGLLVINDDLLSEFINQYFGSQLAISPGLKQGKSLSTTESRINDRVLQLFGMALKSGWKDIASIEMEKTITETNPEFVSVGEKDELGVRFTLDISLGDFTGAIQWLLAYSSIEPLSSLSGNSESAEHIASAEITAQKAVSWSKQLYDNIQEVQLDVHVVIPEFEMSLKDVRALQVGSVLPLKNPGDVHVCIENIPLYYGDYGAHAEQKAVSLKQRIEQ